MAMRLFTAIMLPSDVRRHLEQIQKSQLESRGLSIVRPENLHITLKFLGEVVESRVPHMREALRAVPVESMTLIADRYELFPRRGPVRVISAGVGGDSGEVASLYLRIEEVVASFDIDRERRAFTPHITLARARDGVPRNAAFKSTSPWPGAAFIASTFALVASTLTANGSIYQVIETYP